MISWIMWIKEDTHTVMLKSISNGLFIFFYINTGYLLLLAYANLTEFGGILSKIFNNYYFDFTCNWYTVVGFKFIQTLLINMVFPFVEFGIDYAWVWFLRRLDRGNSKDDYKTKLTSMQQYIELYSGLDYQINYKYSNICNITFVVMMYGLGIPILFGVAALSFFILYSLERLVVAYFYKIPPTFGDEMTKNAVGVMKFASIFHLFFGYWMLSNKQIFSNVYSFVP